MKKIILYIFIVTSVLSCRSAAEKSASGVASRIVPQWSARIEFREKEAGEDKFTISEHKGKLLIEGSNANSLCSGLGYYLANIAGVDVSWDADDPVEIPADLYKVSKRKDFDKLYTHDMIEDYLIFQDILLTTLQAIIFLRTAEVYSKEYVPDPTPTFKRHKNYKPINYTLVDTTWDMNIDVNNPFPVRGHFKMQPYKKDGEWDKKLIYIESYMKSGYHRRAKKEIVYGASE